MPQSSAKNSSNMLSNLAKNNALSMTSKKRCEKLNEGERVQLMLREAQIDRNLRILQHQQNNVMARVHKTRTELLAYQRVVNSEFRAKDFHTLRFGYDMKAARKDPVEHKRLAMETKIYHSGFSRNVLKKKIDAQVIALIPENQIKEQRQQKINILKAKNAPFAIDPHTRSLTIIFKNFAQHKRLHNNPTTTTVVLAAKKDKLPRISEQTVVEETTQTVNDQNKEQESANDQTADLQEKSQRTHNTQEQSQRSPIDAAVVQQQRERLDSKDKNAEAKERAVTPEVEEREEDFNELEEEEKEDNEEVGHSDPWGFGK